MSNSLIRNAWNLFYCGSSFEVGQVFLMEFFSQFQAKLKNLISIPVKCICLGTGVITFHETSKSCTNRGQDTDVAI